MTAPHEPLSEERLEVIGCALSTERDDALFEIGSFENGNIALFTQMTAGELRTLLAGYRRGLAAEALLARARKEIRGVCDRMIHTNAGLQVRCKWNVAKMRWDHPETCGVNLPRDIAAHLEGK